MCLAIFSFKEHPFYKLILAANRDEYYERKSLPFSWHKLKNNEMLLAPVDLRFYGTWFGITKNGKIALLTNYRDPKLYDETKYSRGKLVWNFFESSTSPENFINQIDPNAYNPFNLIFGFIDELYYFSNITNKLEKLSSSIFALSNHLLNTPWPKLLKAKTIFTEIIMKNYNPTNIAERLISMLKDDLTFEDNLPDTGISKELEKNLSPIFVKSLYYGTHTSYVLLIDYKNNVLAIEKNYIHEIYQKLEFSITK